MHHPRPRHPLGGGGGGQHQQQQQQQQRRQRQQSRCNHFPPAGQPAHRSSPCLPPCAPTRRARVGERGGIGCDAGGRAALRCAALRCACLLTPPPPTSRMHERRCGTAAGGRHARGLFEPMAWTAGRTSHTSAASAATGRAQCFEWSARRRPFPPPRPALSGRKAARPCGAAALALP
eukprot:scaffold993_cov393-Prasinococcus_capsulatus_cf.AAC.16